jgi:DGQHR domain-containing protein
MPSPGPLVRRALSIRQCDDHELFIFCLTADEILEVADVSRVSRSSAGELIGYQRPEVQRHVQEILEYLDGEHVLFPNPIILALSSKVRFRHSRGPNVSDGLASAGVLEIPLPGPSDPKPAWIVDGQQRALALSRTRHKNLPVPVNAFVADTVAVQRDQFLRVNNTQPLPRGLVTELLPEVDSPLSPRLALRKIPSALCDLLNREPDSPFFGLIRRTSSSKEERRAAVVTDTSIVNMLQESLVSTSGCLFPYRNIATGETDMDGIWATLVLYWSAVRDAFPEAWGKAPAHSRLMHGAGIRAMGRLMDRVMSTVDAKAPSAAGQVQADLALVAPICRWTEGEWEPIGLAWNEIQNVPKHVRTLSNVLIRTYIKAKMAQ